MPTPKVIECIQNDDEFVRAFGVALDIAKNEGMEHEDYIKQREHCINYLHAMIDHYGTIEGNAWLTIMANTVAALWGEEDG